jgi:rRNA maturation endonuclease Nob1
MPLFSRELEDDDDIIEVCCTDESCRDFGCIQEYTNDSPVKFCQFCGSRLEENKEE